MVESLGLAARTACFPIADGLNAHPTETVSAACDLVGLSENQQTNWALTLNGLWRFFKTNSASNPSRVASMALVGLRIS